MFPSANTDSLHRLPTKRTMKSSRHRREARRPARPYSRNHRGSRPTYLLPPLTRSSSVPPTLPHPMPVLPLLQLPPVDEASALSQWQPPTLPPIEPPTVPPTKADELVTMLMPQKAKRVPEPTPTSEEDSCSICPEPTPPREEDSCSICLEVIRPEEGLASLLCNHDFHMRCILQWMMTKTNCPLCRQHFVKFRLQIRVNPRIA